MTSVRHPDGERRPVRKLASAVAGRQRSYGGPIPLALQMLLELVVGLGDLNR